jgi:hypothetical protein
VTIIPAEWIKISIVDTRDVMCATAVRTEDCDERSSGMNSIFVVGDMAFIISITGETFERERPVSSRVAGEAAARERAVSAPMEPWEGPVMRTVGSVRNYTPFVPS